MSGSGSMTASPALTPLLDGRDLDSIRDALNAHRPPATTRNRLVAHMAIGDINSIHTGGGMDYEESRAYQPGDDSRFMNWRLSARTGKPYVKIFREERRPDLWVLLDRRSNMRFGTRHRLKVAQAAVCACLAVMHASQRMIATGALLLERQPRLQAARHHANAIDHLLGLLTAPCPPLEAVKEPALNDALRRCEACLIRGSHLLVISDFHDLDDTGAALLGRMAMHHSLRAIRISDPVEHRLQDIGHARLADCLGRQTVDIDLSDSGLRQACEQIMAERFQAAARRLARAGIPLLDLDTITPVSGLVSSVLAHMGLP